MEDMPPPGNTQWTIACSPNPAAAIGCYRRAFDIAPR
jgi:hypothetical protein